MQLNPKKIKEYIDRFVVGQEEAKIAVSTALFAHMLRWQHKFIHGETLKKSNLLLMGPSGSGKTFIVRKGIEAIREITGYDFLCPMAEVDCSSLTPPGYVGESFAEILDYFFSSLPAGNPQKKSSAIIFLDEFDKLGMGRAGNDSDSNFTKAVQYSVLKAVEGHKVLIDKASKGIQGDIDTSSFLFIFAGNFPTIRKERVNRDKESIGFVNTNGIPKEKDLLTVQKEVEEAGIATQLVGRISAVAELKELNKEQLREVILESEDSILFQYKKLFEGLDKELYIPDSKISEIVDNCDRNNTGVRGLQAALEEVVRDQIYNLEADF